MRLSQLFLVALLSFVFSCIHQPAAAQRDPAVSRDQFNAELNAIEQFLGSNQIGAGLARALALRGNTRRQFGAFSPEYLKSLDLLAQCQVSAGALKDAASTLKEALAVQIRNASREDVRVIERELELAEFLAVSGDYQGAVQLYNAALPVLQKQLGASDPTVARFLHDFALVLRKAGNDAEAERLMRQSLDIFDKSGPQYSLVVSKVQTDLAAITISTDKLDEAEKLLLSALETLDDPRQQIVGQVEKTLRALTEVNRRTNREESARKFEERADALAPDHLADNNSKLASLWKEFGTLTQSPSAIPVADKIATLTEQLYGPRRFEAGVALNNLGQLYSEAGQYGKAESNLRRAVDVFDRIADRDSYPGWGSNMASSLNNLGLLYTKTSRYVQALPLLERAHLLDLAFSGDSSKNAAVSINNIGLVYLLTGRAGDAEQAFRDALKIDERMSGPDSALVGLRLTNLASALTRAGKYNEAMPLLERARKILGKIGGGGFIGVASLDGQIAGLISALGRLDDAENLYKKALASADEFRRRDAQQLVSALAVDNTMMSLQNGLGQVLVKQAKWPEAVRTLDLAVRLAIAQVEAQASALQKIGAGLVLNRDSRIGPIFEAFVSAAAHLRTEDPSRNSALAMTTFEAAQWAKASTTAAALAEMAMRGLARGDSKQRVRELQDFIVERGLISAYMDSAVVSGAASRDSEKELQLSKRAVEVEARMASIKKSLMEQLPILGDLMQFNPLTVRDVQLELSDNEALVLFFDTSEANPRPEETFIWVITKSEVKWARSDLGTSALAREVSALRCGLDYESAWAVLRSRCPELLQVEYTRADDDAGKPLPFDVARAYTLYKALFGQIEDLIKNKRLLIVSSGPLMQLPFQVLVTDPPQLRMPRLAYEYRDVAWLVRKHAVTVLPAVSSLKALRQYSRDSSATEPFIGFGNPLLSGDPKDPRDISAAGQAGEKQQCEPTTTRHDASRRGTRPIIVGESGLIDLAEIRSQAPLPSTADELCGVAKELGVDTAKQVFLASRATETQVKRLSDTNELQKYQIVEFATHGAIAGDLSRTSEPGLILTPPNEATDRDDGYLSASEISGLKLDADWVILSACNTAAGDERGAEALSGLARAFFYAGARSLLVSHWAVDSQAAVKLVTKAVAELKSHPEIGRSEALRRSMLSMIEASDQDDAHPALWAPFAVVGEGSPSAAKVPRIATPP
jgi:CHAT domain-containing protein/tetratricopeptide (TPR) repeat protein